jgi:membrane associated rhomboid family serine protease
MIKELQGIVWLIATLWLVYLIDLVLPIDLQAYGLVPRTLPGLVGIPLMPFLHGSLGHLLGNTIPLCILLFILLSSRKDYLEIIGSIVILGGLLLWCFGRSAIHVGASGLVYGLVAFLIASGFFERKVVPLFIAVLVGFLYGTTLLFGVLPTAGKAVSWDGHLFGAIAGATTPLL